MFTTLGRATRLSRAPRILVLFDFLFLTAHIPWTEAIHDYRGPDLDTDLFSSSSPPQELGLDPVVSNLHLDRVHPTIQNLAAATQGDCSHSISPTISFQQGPSFSQVLQAEMCTPE